MAECTAYTSIVVSGAGTAAVNGTYVPYTTDTRLGGPKTGQLYTIWTKDGLNSNPRIEVVGSDPGTWAITGIPFPVAKIYDAPDGSYGDTDCPVGLTWSAGPFGSNPAPTVTGISGGGGGGLDPIAERNAKYATATESGAIRFRRLHALGYV